MEKAAAPTTGACRPRRGEETGSAEVVSSLPPGPSQALELGRARAASFPPLPPSPGGASLRPAQGCPRRRRIWRKRSREDRPPLALPSPFVWSRPEGGARAERRRAGGRGSEEKPPPRLGLQAVREALTRGVLSRSRP
ncbi:unnamed protein product [Rangifer tarandus platyrhynchus]|uniref:Uncharacterized protein n=2 Tax=Rangifer tarandus platyrhynchus TaxID=3082113 RepID=A0ABN8YQJ1_RANTA|nr:unnamed protein product [Rangifer tarandus platyrhynchus]CAI9700445.1 unnamed protein product [Rangifer tarandus platyrhynchus]